MVASLERTPGGTQPIPRSPGAREAWSLRALWTGKALTVRWQVVLSMLLLALAPLAALYGHAALADSVEHVPSWLCWAGVGVALVGALAWYAVGRHLRARALRRHAELVDGVLENLEEGVLLVDRGGRLIASNAALRALLGPPPPEGDVVAWLEAAGLHPTGGAGAGVAAEHVVQRALAGSAVPQEVWSRRAAGPTSAAWLSITALPLRDAGGAAQGAMLTLRDVSKRRHAEESHRRLASAIAQTADMVVITDHEGHIEYVNPAFRTITGYEASEALGRTPSLLRSGRHPPEYFARLWRTILAGDVFRGAIVNRRKDGSTYTAEQTITPMKDAAGRVTHFVSVSKDMTEHARLQRQEIELELAARVQRRLYPQSAPRIAGWSVAGGVMPAEETCGDLYDFLPRPNGSLLVAVGDVTGHGVGPALLMSEVRAYLRSLAALPLGLPEILERIHGLLRPDLAIDVFVSLLLVELDAQTRRYRWASAGHGDALVLDAQGRILRRLASTGPVLGVFDAPVYARGEGASLEAGQALILTTDGATECPCEGGAPLGEEGLAALLADLLAQPAETLLREAQQRLRALSQQQGGLRDDLTLVVAQAAAEPGA